MADPNTQEQIFGMNPTKLYVVTSKKRGTPDKLEGVFTDRIWANHYCFDLNEKVKRHTFVNWEPYELQGGFFPGVPVYVAWCMGDEGLVVDSIHDNEGRAKERAGFLGRVERVVPNGELVDFS